VSFPVNQRMLEGVSRRMFEEHPELRIRVCPDGHVGIPASPGLAHKAHELWKSIDRERYPLVLTQTRTIAEGEGIVLAEPVVLLHPRDLPCQADRLD